MRKRCSRFLICENGTLRPLIGIELDDCSHQRADRQKRDADVDRIFGAARLPLLHVPAKSSYDASALDQAIKEKIAGAASA